jgi:hypothetical protein
MYILLISVDTNYTISPRVSLLALAIIKAFFDTAVVKAALARRPTLIQMSAIRYNESPSNQASTKKKDINKYPALSES